MPAEIFSLIGANGADKSSRLRAVSGLINPSQGEIIFQGKNLRGLTPAQITALGIVHVSEGRRISSHLSVLENLEMSAYLLKDKKLIQSEMKKVYDYFPILEQRRSHYAGT